MLRDIFLIIPLLIALLICAIIDYRTRTIPNIICIVIAILCCICITLEPLSIFRCSIAERILGILPSVVMLVLSCLKGGSGGGDIKLMAILGLTIGLVNLVPVLFITTITSLIWAKIKRAKNVPLGTFIAIGVYSYVIIDLML